MIFGKPSRFAIEYELDENSGGEWLYGRLCCWIGGQRVGNYEVVSPLWYALFMWDRIACDAGKRENPELFARETGDLLTTLHDGMYGDEGSPELVRRATDEQWACHQVEPSVEPFHGVWIFLVEDASIGRLLARDYDLSLDHEFHLRRGEFDDVLRDALAVLDAMHVRENANASNAGGT